MAEPTDRTEERMRQQRQIAVMEHGLTNHRPDEDQVARIESIRHFGKEFGRAIIERTNPGRDQSLALTALEDATMRAVRAVVLEGGPS